MARLISEENIIEESLLPCPFCGATSEELSSEGTHRFQIVVLKKHIEEPDSFGIPEPVRTRFFVKCTNCDSSGGSGIAGYNALIKKKTTEEEARKTAIQKWNKRFQ